MKRRATREVMCGPVGIGGNHPIRIQSMTTSNTRDVKATVEQALKLYDAGCEIVRVTVQGIKEAEACEGIKNALLQHGVNIPIVADIHFFPAAAMRAVEFVDKIRINPGNFVDKRASFKVIEYDDESYEKELEKIEEKFTPLVEKCKALKKAMRIGTNHGSLSDRIMNRFGDTPRGMCESALEFARICRKNDYHDIIFSMKASNPKVMIEAYRMLAKEMDALGWDYPLHLGVTEAGSGEDGRIKSAMGIGSLLLEGLGDTIRVSLTEDPWFEIDPCKRLISFINYAEQKGQLCPPVFLKEPRKTLEFPKHISLHRDGSVFLSVKNKDLQGHDFYHAIGCKIQFGKPKIAKTSPDVLVVEDDESLKAARDLQEAGISVFQKRDFKSLQQVKGYKKQNLFTPGLGKPHFPSAALMVQDEEESFWDALKEVSISFIVLKLDKNRLSQARKFFQWLGENNIKVPVILNFSYTCSKEDLLIQASAEAGSLLCDGLGDGLLIEGPYEIAFLKELSFNLLQAARMRSVKTDFISCPSCGRTLFNLQEVTKKIQEKTSHLPGVKIAIMGCIVNGPGEMADADFGYVGSKPGMIDLYVGKTCVEKDIAFDNAVDHLIALIKKQGRWIDALDVSLPV